MNEPHILMCPDDCTGEHLATLVAEPDLGPATLLCPCGCHLARREHASWCLMTVDADCHGPWSPECGNCLSTCTCDEPPPPPRFPAPATHDPMCPCHAEPWKQDGYIDPEFGNVVYMPCHCAIIDRVRRDTIVERTLARDLIGVTDAAKVLGVTRARVVQMIHEGKLVSWRIGHALAVSGPQVERLS